MYAQPMDVQRLDAGPYVRQERVRGELDIEGVEEVEEGREWAWVW
jgi:hypothetical protein